MNLRLCYGNVHVGNILNAVESDETWYGLFSESPQAEESSPLTSRLHNYILFSRQWHARVKVGANFSAEEFESFADLSSSGLWRAEATDGRTYMIENSPTFIEDDISWHNVPA